MRIFRGLPSPKSRRACAAAIGNFDGVHLGHQALLRQAVVAARAQGIAPAAITFEPHPRDFFAAKVPPARISSLRDKAGDMAALGIEDLYILRFDHAFAALASQEFADRILRGSLAVRHLVVGDDFRFGSDRGGDAARLQAFSLLHGFSTEVVDGVDLPDGRRISSSAVRRALAAGDVADAAAMLGHEVRITGRVMHGARLGRTIGFPTLNVRILPPGFTGVPAIRGVWAVTILGLDGDARRGVASLGVKPTVTNDGVWTLEVNVFDWSGDAYGKTVRIVFEEKLRDEKRFGSLQELTGAIRADALRARRFFQARPMIS